MWGGCRGRGQAGSQSLARLRTIQRSFPHGVSFRKNRNQGWGSSLAIEVPKGRGWGAAASGGGKVQGSERERERGGGERRAREVDKWRRRGIVA